MSLIPTIPEHRRSYKLVFGYTVEFSMHGDDMRTAWSPNMPTRPSSARAQRKLEASYTTARNESSRRWPSSWAARSWSPI
jgi:hypothetical protein